MRSRISLVALLFAAGSFALPLVAYAGIPNFGPIIPQGGYAVCAAGWPMLITVINNIIELLITLAIVFVAPLSIAYSGFLFVVNPFNSGGKEQAKKILTNTVVGIVIALAGWLIVDALMAVLYNPQAVGETWWSIVNSGTGDMCLPQNGTFYQAGSAPGVTGGAPSTAPLSFGSGPCDPTLLKQYVPSLTQSQANTLACLAKPESACGANIKNGYWDKATPFNGLASTAYGAFQVTLSTNHRFYENQACYEAAGVQGPLNCQNGFGAGGFIAGGNATTLANCMRAAANLGCSANAAAGVMRTQGFSAWTADPRSSLQKQCIAQYSGG